MRLRIEREECEGYEECDEYDISSREDGIVQAREEYLEYLGVNDYDEEDELFDWDGVDVYYIGGRYYSIVE